ncbi:MAG: rhomboid family intramembrane serine protease [Phycisphaerae bacterium]
MIIPVRTDYRMSHPPWVNYAIIAANAGIFLLGYNGLSAHNERRIAAWLLQPDAPTLEQFFTCMFLHASWVHLLGNMLFLWVFGNPMNDRFGHVGYLAFYLAGGVLAGVGYIVLGGAGPVLGASGAICAVTGAYLVLLPRARVTLLVLLIWIFVPFDVSSLYFVLVQVIFNLAHTLGGGGGGVAYSAHSAGYAFGIGVAVLLLAIKALPRDPFDLLNLVRTWRRRTRYRQMVAQGYDPFGFVRPVGQKPPSQWVNVRTVQSTVPNTNEARELELRRDISETIARGDLAGAAEKYLQLVQIAEDAVLSRQQQRDVANQLMLAEKYPAAADAYERFLRHYGQMHEDVADILLMLGIIYSRYLHQYDRARQLLEQAAQKLSDPRRLEMANRELASLRLKR